MNSHRPLPMLPTASFRKLHGSICESTFLCSSTTMHGEGCWHFWILMFLMEGGVFIYHSSSLLLGSDTLHGCSAQQLEVFRTQTLRRMTDKCLDTRLCFFLYFFLAVDLKGRASFNRITENCLCVSPGACGPSTMIDETGTLIMKSAGGTLGSLPVGKV